MPWMCCVALPCLFVYSGQGIFLRKSDCLGCAVLLCLVVCLTYNVACFFLPYFSSLIKTCTVYVTFYTCRKLFLLKKVKPQKASLNYDSFSKEPYMQYILSTPVII